MPWARRLTPAWWVTAAAGATVFAIDLHGELRTPRAPIAAYAYLATMVFMSTCGFVVWAVRWRFNPLGSLWAISPIIHVVENLPAVYPTSKAATTTGNLLLGVGAVVGAQWVLSYPSGRLWSRWAKRWLVVTYVVTFASNLPYVLYLPSYFYVGAAPFNLVTYDRLLLIFVLVPIVASVEALYIQRLRLLSPGARRTAAPLLIGALVFNPIWLYLVARQLWQQSSAIAIEQTWLNAGFLFLFSVLAISGLFFSRRARGVVGDLVLDLGDLGPGGVRKALAKALGDPGLRVGFWLPDRGIWAEDDGAPLELPSGHEQGVTYLGRDRLAVMLHDPDLVDQAALLESVRSAAGFALENERLRTQLLSQLVELRNSRARIVRTADEERRRLERDLHDGAQQRLLGVGMALQLLHGHVDNKGDAILAETQTALQQALHELRELARGIHPAILTDSGLAAAIRTLAQRAPLDVDVDLDEQRLPAAVETAAYYVVAEALTNIAKYANASRASILLRRDDGLVHIDVRDDGVGGADPASGTGLRGLADRVGALNGTLSVRSVPGAGTHLVAEIPCEQ